MTKEEEKEKILKEAQEQAKILKDRADKILKEAQEQAKLISEGKNLKKDKNKHVSGKKLSAFIIAIIVIAIAISYGSGFILGKILYEDKKECPKLTVTTDSGSGSLKKLAPYNESLVINKYTENAIYLLNDGKVYFVPADEIFVSLDFCNDNPSHEYCAMNPTYTTKMNEITGLTNVSKIKLLRKLDASDESFTTIAILENGSVYELNNGAVSLNTKYNNVKDIKETVDGKYIVTKLDGSDETIEFGDSTGDILAE